MADEIDKSIDAVLEDTFRPAPDRTMYGKQWQNVPWDVWNKKGSRIALSPYDPANEAGPPPNSDYITTQDNPEAQMLMWRLRQLLSN